MKITGKSFFTVVVLILIFGSICAGAETKSKNYPVMHFLGAAQSIGGSAILIETEKTRFLIDYGLHYDKPENNTKMVFYPPGIDFVLLTHAHIDHSGRLPMLYKNGFTGKVIGIDATGDIAGRMLDMSVKFAESEEIKLFSREDLNEFMKHFEAVEYGKIISITPDIEVRFNEAGHILGSAIIEIWIEKEKKKLKLVAGGDMGGKGIPVIRDRAQIADGDYVIVESTYGDKAKGIPDYRSFVRDIDQTLKKGGSVLIPAFVLEKTQKVIAILCEMKRKDAIPADVPIYVDSSTARDITNIYRSYEKYYDPEAKELLAEGLDPFSCNGLQEISGKKALETHFSKKPSIYISSSGMLEHANSPKHLNEMIGDKNDLLAIVGWQAPNTPGRKLQEGAKIIDIPIETFRDGKLTTEIVSKPVIMTVSRYDAFSSHADGCETLEWLSNFKSIGKVFVVHGEKKSTINLSNRISKYLGIPSEAPVLDQSEKLEFDVHQIAVKQSQSKCDGMIRDVLESNITDQ